MKKQIKEKIITTRTELRILQLGDLDNYYLLISNNRDRLIESFPITAASTIDKSSTEEYLKKIISQCQEGVSYFYGMWYKDELIGIQLMKDIVWRIPKCEVGYFISKNYEGEGFATEGLKALCSYCFGELGMIKICANIIPSNKSSINIVEKIGFILEGTLKSDFRTGNDKIVDTNCFGLVNNDFENKE